MPEGQTDPPPVVILDDWEHILPANTMPPFLPGLPLHHIRTAILKHEPDFIAAVPIEPQPFGPTQRHPTNHLPKRLLILHVEGQFSVLQVLVYEALIGRVVTLEDVERN
jgi:hypothetical protein